MIQGRIGLPLPSGFTIPQSTQILEPLGSWSCGSIYEQTSESLNNSLISFGSRMAFDYWQEFFEEGIYHLYNKSVTGEKMFRDSDDYKRFTSKYERYFGSYFDTFAYSLIPNHFHFLIKVKPLNKTVLELIAKEDTRSAQELASNKESLNQFLSDQLRRWLSSHSLYFNRKYQRTGPLLMNKVKRVGCKNKEQVKDLICYIHHNAIHHGLSQDIGQWDFDSFSLFKVEKERTLIARREVMELLGNHANFQAIHVEYKSIHCKVKYHRIDSSLGEI